MYRGDIRLGDTIDLKFTTRSFTTGAPTQLAGTPSVAAYPGNSTTEITAGITLTVDFDTRTGLNNVRVVATSGNGYATATNYDLVITAGTVGGVSVVGEVIGSFSIEARSAVMPTVAARTLDVSATGEAGIDWANIGSPTTAVNLSATNIDVDQVVASVSGAVGSVTGAVGSVTGNVGGNVTGSVGSVATGGITSGSFAAGAINAAAIAADAIGASELAADAVAEIADAVWDEARAGHVAAGSFGEGVASVQGNVTGSVASVTGAVGSVTGAVGSVTGNVGGNVVGSVASVTAAVTVGTNNDKTGYALTAAYDPAKTAAQAGDAMALTAAERNSTADALLDRNVSGGSSAGRTVKQALHVLRNKSQIAAGTLTVYDTDDTTSSWTAAVTTTAGDPISQIDPA